MESIAPVHTFWIYSTVRLLLLMHVEQSKYCIVWSEGAAGQCLPVA